MLRELAVQNLAVIEDVRVELVPGFCAWTGETGAGKSLLLSGIGLLLGERGSADLIRLGQDELRITGRFELTRPEQREAAESILQSTLDDENLILSRRLTRGGRSSAYVNEQPVAIGTLRRLGELLVDVHGQRESYSLLQPSYQLELLDAFGKLTHLREQYQSVAEEVRRLRKQHRDLAEAQQNRQRELALIRFERDDLDAAQLQANEEESLDKERDKLLHAQSLAMFTAGVADRLYDDESSVGVVLARLLKEAGKWAMIDDKLQEIAHRLDALKPEIRDIAETCREYSEAYDSDPQRLNAIEHRLQLFKKLEAKYNRGIDELVKYRQTLDAKEAALQRQEDDFSGIDSALSVAVESLRKVADQLSKGRAKVAKKLVAQTQKHFADLGMPKAKLDAELSSFIFDEASDVPADGFDHLELMLTANPGEPARPLRKVASGGELSRTMLALKTVLAAHDPVRTLVVFDEIDANVGGRLGDMLGQKLANLGESHQVLCVTHLPQVASYATHQWTIRKSSTGKRTSTTIAPLTTSEERIEELAMMLRGEARSDTTRQEAQEMLTASQPKPHAVGKRQ